MQVKTTSVSCKIPRTQPEGKCPLLHPHFSTSHDTILMTCSFQPGNTHHRVDAGPVQGLRGEGSLIMRKRMRKQWSTQRVSVQKRANACLWQEKRGRRGGGERGKGKGGEKNGGGEKRESKGRERMMGIEETHYGVRLRRGK